MAERWQLAAARPEQSGCFVTPFHFILLYLPRQQFFPYSLITVLIILNFPEYPDHIYEFFLPSHISPLTHNQRRFDNFLILHNS